MARGQSLQDPFLNALRKEHIPVSIYLVNGIKLQGQIDSFDQFVVLLKNTVSQMVYKHAISTVVPARAVRLSADEEVTVETLRLSDAMLDTGMFDRPRAGERAILVRLGLGAPVNQEDLDEFEQLARSRRAPCPWLPSPAGASVRTRAISSAGARPQRSRAAAASENADLILIDHALSPSQERNLEKLVRTAGPRSQRTDPRHLRAARPQLRGQAGGRVGAAEASSQPPGARLDPPGASKRRYRPAWPGRDAAGDRSTFAGDTGAVP